MSNMLALLAEETATSTIVTIDDYWLQMIIGSLLPWVVQLVTRRFAAGAVKSAVLLFLSVLTGFFMALQTNDGQFEATTGVVSIVLTFVTALATHKGLWKPFGVTGDDGAIARAVPAGIGSAQHAHRAGA